MAAESIGARESQQGGGGARHLMPFTAAEIARQVGGKLTGDGSVQLKGMSLPDTARAGDLTFAENADYFVRAEKSAATAILVDDLLGVKANRKVLISVANARVA